MHTVCVLRTARISNVESVLCDGKERRMEHFRQGEEIKRNRQIDGTRDHIAMVLPVKIHQ